MDTVLESGRGSPFSEKLLAIVAIDDAWGLLLFSLLLAIAQAVSGQGGGLQVLTSGVWEIVGALLLGAGLGVPMAYVTGRIRPGEPSQAEALGVVLLCAGLAVWLDVSSILAAMALGAVVANLARHHDRPFHAIMGIEWPFLILFFLLAGASLHLGALAEVGVLGLVYIAMRSVGRTRRWRPASGRNSSTASMR